MDSDDVPNPLTDGEILETSCHHKDDGKVLLTGFDIKGLVDDLKLTNPLVFLCLVGEGGVEDD